MKKDQVFTQQVPPSSYAWASKNPEATSPRYRQIDDPDDIAYNLKTKLLRLVPPDSLEQIVISRRKKPAPRAPRLKLKQEFEAQSTPEQYAQIGEGLAKGELLTTGFDDGPNFLVKAKVLKLIPPDKFLCQVYSRDRKNPIRLISTKAIRQTIITPGMGV